MRFPEKHGFTRRSGAVAGTAAVAGLGLLLAGCGEDKLKGPAAEVKPHTIKLDLPAVPAFDLPAAPDGMHSVKELRVRGKKLLDTEISVKGYVTWAYDCATDIRTAEMTDADVQKKIDEDPQACQRPKFYLGDTADTPVEKSLWVVEVPRLPNKLQRERLPKEELKAWPAVPPYKVGDEITVTGTFALETNHGERNSNGLMMYKSLVNTTQAWTPPPVVPAPAP